MRPWFIICPAHDTIGRKSGENWYAGSTTGSPTETISLTYNPAGWLQSATDYNAANSATSTDSYTYDLAGEVRSDTQTVPGLAPSVALNETYLNGNRTQLAASIGGTADFVNNYTYGGIMGQMSQVTQSGVSGGDSVAPKAASFGYDTAGEFNTVNRYNNVGATQLVAAGTYGYDGDGNMTSLVYTNGGSTLRSYSWTYDPLGNVSTSYNNADGSVTYTNDSTGQLTSAAYTGSQGNESYVYDPNGNRDSAGSNTYATGANNEILSDGTYTYAYDAEGNLITRWVASTSNEWKPGANDTKITVFTWDNRNRLTSVNTYSTYAKYHNGQADQTVTYFYDAFDRWVGETTAPAGGSTVQTRFIYDGKQIVLQFDDATPLFGPIRLLTANASLTNDNLSHRFLWGPGVDQLLVDEQMSAGEEVVWTLGDNQNTVRDLALYSNGVTTVFNHRVFSAYGQILSQTNPQTGQAAWLSCLFAYTGRPLSVFSVNAQGGAVTCIQNNGKRWYDAITGRWLSQDPLGLAPDTNPYRYCGNGPMNAVDPSGLYAFDEFAMSSGDHGAFTHPPDNPPLTAAPAPPAPVPIAPPALGLVPGAWPSTGTLSMSGPGSMCLPRLPVPPPPPYVTSKEPWQQLSDEPITLDGFGILQSGYVPYSRNVRWSNGSVTQETSAQCASIINDEWQWDDPEDDYGTGESSEVGNPHGPEAGHTHVPSPFDAKGTWRDPRDIP